MDPVSVALGCIALLPPITKASTSIATFVLEVREARKEMNMVQAELVALRSVLEILAQDMKDCPEHIFPSVLVENIKSIIAECKIAVNEIERCIAAHTVDQTSKSIKWALFGRETMLRYKSILGAYQSALNMAIDTLNISISKDIKVDTTNLLANTSDLKEDTSQILQEIAKLQARLPDGGKDSAHYLLHRYLHSLTDYAESSFGRGSARNSIDDSPRPTPIEETSPPADKYIHHSSGSSSTTQSQYPYASISGSARSVQGQTQGVPLLQTRSLPTDAKIRKESFLTVSDSSWYNARVTPTSIPDPQFATEGHMDLVYTLCQTTDFIISGSRDQTIRVWNTATRRLAYPPLTGHNSSVFHVVADHEADILVSCAGNGSLIIWQLSTGRRKNHVSQAHSDSILSIKLNSKYLISTSKDCTAKIWARQSLEQPREQQMSEPFPHSVLRGHSASINAVVLTEEEAITACGDRKIRVFNLDSGTCIQQMSSHEKTIASLSISADGQYIISAGGDADIVIHHKQSGRAIARLKGHNDLVRALMISHGDNLIVSGSYDETVAIWAFKEDEVWKKERSLDVKETQRILGLDLLERQRSLDFTANIRQAVTTGTENAALSSGRVFCIISTKQRILCGAGCTIVGWEFASQSLAEEEEEEEEERPTRTQSSESRKMGKRRQLFQHIKDRF